jgi:hypothetical protein
VKGGIYYSRTFQGPVKIKDSPGFPGSVSCVLIMCAETRK